MHHPWSSSISTVPKYGQMRTKQYMPKPKIKTAILSFRVEPRVRAVIERAADAERRSLANMAEILILEGCERRGITTPESPPVAQATKPKAKRKPGK